MEPSAFVQNSMTHDLIAAAHASIISTSCCGATVCRTHLHLVADCAFYCDGNYVCTQIPLLLQIILVL